MFDEREPIQIIGLNFDEEATIDPYTKFNAMKLATQWNEDMKLQNRYDKAIAKLDRIKEELENKIEFCEREADGTVNNTNCRIAISFYKRLLDIIMEG